MREINDNRFKESFPILNSILLSFLFLANLHRIEDSEINHLN